MLRWLISAVGVAALKGEVSGAVQRGARRALLMALVLVLWLAALAFAIAALAVWLSEELGRIAACGIIAGGFAVLALVIQLTLALSARRKPVAGLKGPFPNFFASGAEGGAEAGSLGSMAVVALAGYLLGRQLVRK